MRSEGVEVRALPSEAGGHRQQAAEEGLSVGQRRQVAHVGEAIRKVDHGGAAAQQFLETLGSRSTGTVVVECQEDAGTAPQDRRHLVKALGAQGQGLFILLPGRKSPSCRKLR